MGERKERWRLRRVLRPLWHGPVSALPFEIAVLVAERILASQGFGAGAQVTKSGELAVFDLVAAKERPILLDIGAHVGDYSAEFLARFPSGRAFAIEPSGTNFGKLRARLGNRINAECVNVALCAAPGEGALYKDAEVSPLASLTRRRLDHLGIKMDMEERVKLSTLDEVRNAAGIEFIDLVKIDVEGHELAVLQGATGAFEQQALGVVQFEFGGCNLDTRTTFQDFFYFFAHYGYEINIIRPSGKLHALPRYSEIYEQYRTTNYVAVPARLR